MEEVENNDIQTIYESPELMEIGEFAKITLGAGHTGNDKSQKLQPLPII